MRDLTGFAIGGIPPFGHDVPLATFMDQDLLQYDVVWAAAGTPRAVFSADPKKLQASGQGDSDQRRDSMTPPSQGDDKARHTARHRPRQYCR